jgi:hypothetical protein
MDDWEVARKNGCQVLISAAKPHDFKVLRGVMMRGEERS